MVYSDRALTCRDCGRTFIFTASEQEFFALRGLTHDPTRCKECRAARRSSKGHDNQRSHQGHSDSPERTTYRGICADCGAEAELPFEPREGRPVYCQSCYRRRRHPEIR